MNAVWMHEHEKDISDRDWASVDRRIAARCVDIGLISLQFPSHIYLPRRQESDRCSYADYLKSIEKAAKLSRPRPSTRIPVQKPLLLISEGIESSAAIFQKNYTCRVPRGFIKPWR